jgi:hypothetical protein
MRVSYRMDDMDDGVCYYVLILIEVALSSYAVMSTPYSSRLLISFLLLTPPKQTSLQHIVLILDRLSQVLAPKAG